MLKSSLGSPLPASGQRDVAKSASWGQALKYRHHLLAVARPLKIGDPATGYHLAAPGNAWAEIYLPKRTPVPKRIPAAPGVAARLRLPVRRGAASNATPLEATN